MEKRQKKIILLVFIVFTVLGVGVFALSQVFDEKTVSEKVIVLLEEAFPDSNVKIDTLSVTYGPRLKVKGVGLTSKHFRIHAFELKIPVVSLITGGGHVDALLKETIVKISKEQSENKPGKKRISIPAYLANSSGSFRFEKVIVDYEGDGLKKEIPIERFILKNVGLHSKAAFEIKTNLDTKVKDWPLQGDIFVVGTFDMANYVTQGTLPLKVDYKLTNISLNNRNNLLSTLSGKMNLSMNSEGEIAGEGKVFHQTSTLYFTGTLNDKMLDLNKVNYRIVPYEFTNLLKEISFSEQSASTEFSGTGALKWSNESFKPILKTSFENLSLNIPGFNYPLTGEFTYNDKKLSAAGRAKIKKGSLSFSLMTPNYLSGEKSFEKVFKGYQAALEVSSLDAKEIKPLWRNLTSHLKDKMGKYFLLPQGSVQVQMSDLKFKEEYFTGMAQISTGKNKVTYKATITPPVEGKPKTSSLKNWRAEGSLTLFEKDVEKHGVFKVKGEDFSKFSQVLDLKNEFVESTGSYSLVTDYSHISGKPKKVTVKLSGKDFKINSRVALRKMGGVRKDLENWGFWKTFEQDFDNKAKFDEFDFLLNREGEKLFIDRFNLKRKGKTLNGKGSLTRVKQNLVGNMELQIKKEKKKPIKIYLIKDKESLKLNKSKILKQF